MLTVFTCAVYPDLARLWYACVTRAFPCEGTAFEIFDDSGGTIDPAWFPRATILRYTGARRDFQEAYNDALRRVSTPYLAFIDTDVFWTSRDLWKQVSPRLSQTGVAAVSCVSRRHRRSHGTFSVFVNVAAYRRVLEKVPDGFLPHSVQFGPDVPISEWTGYDTGDRMTEVAIEAGYEVELRHFDDHGAPVCFDSVTMYRRTAERVGARPLARMTHDSNWMWRGSVSSMVLQRLHNGLFPGSRFEWQGPSHSPSLITGIGRRWTRGVSFAATCWKSAKRIQEFLESPASVTVPDTL